MQGRIGSANLANLESIMPIPADHFLFKVNKLVDLSFIHELTKPLYSKNKGRPSIDPELFIRIMLIGVIYNIKSDRQLCEEVKYNMLYRYFCKLTYDQAAIPHHSSLCRIRKRFGEVLFEQLFRHIVELCKSHGLANGEDLMTDSTLVEANASLDSMRPKDKNIREELIEGRVNSFVKRIISNKTHYSLTDMEATLAYKAGSIQSLKYKTHFTIDQKLRIIVDCYVTTGGCHESQDYLKRLEYIERQFSWKIKTVTADRAYGTGENINSLQKKDIISYIPLFNNRSGISLHEGFIFDAAGNRYVCKAGKFLSFKCLTLDNRTHYQAQPKDCSVCHLSDGCLKTKNQKKYGQLLSIHPHQHLFDETKQRAKTPEFLQQLRDRFWKMEGIIAEAKNLHGLKRAIRRGRAKLQIQVYLISMVQNIKRLLKAFEANLSTVGKVCFS